MVALEQGLAHAQSALVVRQRLLVLAQLSVHHPNAVEGLSNVGMVALEQGLVHAQSALLVLQRLFVLGQFVVRYPNVAERLSNFRVVALTVPGPEQLQQSLAVPQNVLVVQ